MAAREKNEKNGYVQIYGVFPCRAIQNIPYFCGLLKKGDWSGIVRGAAFFGRLSLPPVFCLRARPSLGSESLA
jgi:hypothetical protein